jgi:hypothetical protein
LTRADVADLGGMRALIRGAAPVWPPRAASRRPQAPTGPAPRARQGSREIHEVVPPAPAAPSPRRRRPRLSPGQRLSPGGACRAGGVCRSGGPGRPGGARLTGGACRCGGVGRGRVAWVGACHRIRHSARECRFRARSGVECRFRAHFGAECRLGGADSRRMSFTEHSKDRTEAVTRLNVDGSEQDPTLDADRRLRGDIRSQNAPESDTRWPSVGSGTRPPRPSRRPPPAGREQ